MENRIAELEKRVAELEEKINTITIYSEGANVSFENSTIHMLQILGDGADFALENTPLDSVEISDDGNNVGFSDCPIGTCAAGSDLDDLKKWQINWNAERKILNARQKTQKLYLTILNLKSQPCWKN